MKCRARSQCADDVTHRVKSGWFANEKSGGGKRPTSEDHSVFGAVRQNQPLVPPEKHHVMVARNRAATNRTVADCADIALETRTVAAPLCSKGDAAPVSRCFTEGNSGAGRRISFVPMIILYDLDIPVPAKHVRGALHQFAEERDPERGVRSSQNGNVFCSVRDALVSERVKSGRTDEDWNAPGDRTIQAGLKRSRRGEIDHHVSAIVVDLEPRIIGDGSGNSLTHAPIRREQADADRLLDTAHDYLMAQHRCLCNQRQR